MWHQNQGSGRSSFSSTTTWWRPQCKLVPGPWTIMIDWIHNGGNGLFWRKGLRMSAWSLRGYRYCSWATFCNTIYDSMYPIGMFAHWIYLYSRTKTGDWLECHWSWMELPLSAGILPPRMGVALLAIYRNGPCHLLCIIMYQLYTLPYLLQVFYGVLGCEKSNKYLKLCDLLGYLRGNYRQLYKPQRLCWEWPVP